MTPENRSPGFGMIPWDLPRLDLGYGSHYSRGARTGSLARWRRFRAFRARDSFGMGAACQEIAPGKRDQPPTFDGRLFGLPLKALVLDGLGAKRADRGARDAATVVVPALVHLGEHLGEAELL